MQSYSNDWVHPTILKFTKLGPDVLILIENGVGTHGRSCSPEANWGIQNAVQMAPVAQQLGISCTGFIRLAVGAPYIYPKPAGTCYLDSSGGHTLCSDTYTNRARICKCV